MSFDMLSGHAIKDLMRYGLVDLGTNSIRHDIYDFSHGSKPKKLHKEKNMIRLGENLFEKGHVDPKAEDRLVAQFHQIKKLHSEFGVNQSHVFATSALREAKDSSRVISRVKKETGFEIKLLSGQKEAEMIALGILKNDHRCHGDFGLIDIGGGSTEISFCKSNRLVHSVSLPLGVARLQQRFLKTSPPKKFEDCQTHIKEVFNAHDWPKEAPSISRFIGSSGTIKSLNRIHKKVFRKKGITAKNLAYLRDEIRLQTVEEIVLVPGMESKRADIILAGILILDQAMEYFNISRLEFSRYALRDGLLEFISSPQRS